MDVTVDNFEEMLPLIKELCHSCDFIAFDEEMTGIMSKDPAKRITKEDDAADRYAKMIEVATKYSIISFGVCFFHKKIVRGFDTYEATPFNFYLFPSGNADLVLSAPSINFLKENNMSFDKWIYKGVSYCDEKSEQYHHERIIEPLSKPINTDAIELMKLTRPNDLEFYNSNTERFNAFAANPYEYVFTFDKCNPYLRRSLYLFLEKFYPQGYSNSTVDGQIIVNKIPPAEWAEYLVKRENEAKEKFRKIVGFRLIIKEIIASAKPIVGHNCIYDLLFMLNSFCFPLPASFDELRENVQSRFPIILDTKHIASSGIIGNQFQETALGPLYKQLLNTNKCSNAESSEEPVEFVYCCPEYASLVSEDAFHNAGYDAFTTGSLFALEVKYNRDVLATTGVYISVEDSYKDVLSKATNILFLMVNFFNLDLNASSKTGQVLRQEGTIIHVTSLQPNKDTADVSALLGGVGVNTNTLDFVRIPKTDSFLVAIGGSDDSILVPLAENKDWICRPYSYYVQQKREPAPVESAAPPAVVPATAAAAEPEDAGIFTRIVRKLSNTLGVSFGEPNVGDKRKRMD